MDGLNNFTEIFLLTTFVNRGPDEFETVFYCTVSCLICLVASETTNLKTPFIQHHHLVPCQKALEVLRLCVSWLLVPSTGSADDFLSIHRVRLFMVFSSGLPLLLFSIYISCCKGVLKSIPFSIYIQWVLNALFFVWILFLLGLIKCSHINPAVHGTLNIFLRKHITSALICLMSTFINVIICHIFIMSEPQSQRHLVPAALSLSLS